MFKEKIVTHVTPYRIILAIQKWQTYKDYPIELFHREFVEAQSQLDGTFHQVMDGKPRWLNYTL